MIDIAVSLSPGLLREVHATGVLGWGDVHVAQKLSHLFGESDQRVQLALALTVRALREGSTCLELDHVDQARFETEDESFANLPEGLWPQTQDWLTAIAASPLVSIGAEPAGERPLRLVGSRLYLERYWQEETTVATELVNRRGAVIAGPDPVQLRELTADLFTDRVDPDQAVATVVPLYCAVSVIAGGPGTGKTHTLARVLAMLTRTSQHPPLIALAAPTGKAAVRMDEAMTQALTDLPEDVVSDLAALRASTIHRLLGWVPESRNRFQHHRGNPLPHDVVVVDEASMVSVTLMARLLAALRPTARLILVGDPHQLAPVEAGAVLADIVDAPMPPVPKLTDGLASLELPDSGPVAQLSHNHRSEQSIATFAAAILSGDAPAVLSQAKSGLAAVSFAETAEATPLRERVTEVGLAMIRAAQRGDVETALAQLERHRLLCAHRHGPHGVSTWSRTVAAWLGTAMPGFDLTAQWYPGRPLLITQNSPDLGLFNGDTGVVVERDGQLRAYFARGGRTQAVSPFLLQAVQTIHAMTVHKAQGSQFAEVSVILPDADSPLLTRELLYTAVTRAETQVNLIGSADALAQAVTTRARRASGLRDRL
jgi:exodeoxyribonuclease V alpha subunit